MAIVIFYYSDRFIRIAWTILLGVVCLCGCQKPSWAETASETVASPAVEVGTQPIEAGSSKPAPTQTSLPPTQIETSPTEIVNAEANETAVPELSPLVLQPPENRTRYQIEARLDYAEHRLAVKEWITYTNRSTDTLGFLQLVVEAARYPGTFDLDAINDQANKRIFQFHLKDTLLSVWLPQPLLPGESTQVGLVYSLQLVNTDTLPQIRPYPLGYTDMQANFGDWYPYTAPYISGEGWLAHAPAMFGEHQVYEISDFEVTINLEGKATDLVIAASTPAVNEEGLYRYTQLAARSFAWSASPHYEVLTRTVDLGEADSALLSSYHFPLQAEAGASLLETMAQALPLYTRLFGAEASHYLVSVQADFLDGMEYDGLFFLSTDYYNWHKPDTPEDFLTALGAHETAHQWWYRLVGNDQAIEPWLDEALCTYSERLFFENIAPEALDWWWTWRVNYYEPQGWVDISIYEATQAPKQWRSYRDPVYLRGAIFLEELRTLMGDDAFFSALREYVQQYAHSIANSDEFLEILKQHSTKDLGGIYNAFLGKSKNQP